MASSPTVLDDYEFISEFPEGGFGKVWKVKCKKTGEVYARREFKGELSEKEEDVKKETRRLTEIGLNNTIVQFFKFGNNYILMQLCDLGDLDSYYQQYMNNTTNPCNVNQLMSDMIQGLRFLHDSNIPHGDLKPANVLIHAAERPICKLSDYGLSKLSPSGKSSTYPGTPFYLAPDTDENPMASDIFSLGVIFFVLFSKQTEVEGNKTFLAPTIEGKKLLRVEDSLIKEDVEARLFDQPASPK